MPKKISDIIRETRTAKGFNRSEMARELGIASQLYGKYEDGKIEPKTDFRIKFEEVFGIDLINFETNSSNTKKEKRRIPLIGEAAASTDLEINVQDSAIEMEYIDVGDMLRDSEAAFTVYGNSMNPNYPSGCILGIRHNYDSFIQPGEIYLLVTRSNRVFKRLYYNDDKTGYVCHSDNTMEHEKGKMKGQAFYPPFEVKGSDVISIYDIVGMIKRTRNSGVIMRQN